MPLWLLPALSPAQTDVTLNSDVGARIQGRQPGPRDSPGRLPDDWQSSLLRLRHKRRQRLHRVQRQLALLWRGLVQSRQQSREPHTHAPVPAGRLHERVLPSLLQAQHGVPRRRRHVGPGALPAAGLAAAIAASARALAAAARAARRASAAAAAARSRGVALRGRPLQRRGQRQGALRHDARRVQARVPPLPPWYACGLGLKPF